MTLTDFWFGYVTDKVYRTPVQNLTRLKRRMTLAVRSVTEEMLQNVGKTLKTADMLLFEKT